MSTSVGCTTDFLVDFLVRRSDWTLLAADLVPVLNEIVPAIIVGG